MKLTHKVLLLLFGIIVGSLTVTTVIELSKLRKKFTQELNTSHMIILTNLMSNLSGAMFNVDDKRIHSQVKSAFSFGSIKRILVVDDKGRLTIYYHNSSSGPVQASTEEIQAWPKEELKALENPLRKVDSAITNLVVDQGIVGKTNRKFTGVLWYFEDDRETFVGHIIFEFGLEDIGKNTNELASDKIVSAIILALILLLGIFYYLRVSVLQRLENLRSAVNRIGCGSFLTII